jgi:surface protein
VFVQNARNSNRDFGCFSFKLGANEPHHSTRNVSTLDYQYVNGGTYALPNINFSIDCDAHNLAVELIPDDQYLGCQITKVDGQWITIFMEFMDNNNKNISFFYYFEEDGFDQIGQYSYILAFNELPPYGSQNGDPQTGYWVDSHEGMFSNADRITAVYMDTQHSQNLSGMFMGATSFTGQNGTSNISNWDVSHTVELDNMFFGARLFNQGLNNWDVSSVQDMDHMFFEARLFNQDLNNWNVANVTHSIEMFRNAIAFDRDLSNWNLAHVNPPNRAGMFDGAINMPNAHMPP